MAAIGQRFGATIDKFVGDAIRITSYNVCYTKLLRHFTSPPAYRSRRNLVWRFSDPVTHATVAVVAPRRDA